jgi:hypothetical protein
MQFGIEDHEVWKKIDSSAYLFLNKLTEPRDNALRIVLDEAVASPAEAGPKMFPGGINLGESTPIKPTSNCLIFVLNWKSYVAYCVTEEMVGSCGKYEDEIYTGRLIRSYSKSHFLDFIEKNTGAHFEPYRHYKIACLNHIIDIVSSSEPELQAISRDETGLMEG